MSKFKVNDVVIIKSEMQKDRMGLFTGAYRGYGALVIEDAWTFYSKEKKDWVVLVLNIVPHFTIMPTNKYLLVDEDEIEHARIQFVSCGEAGTAN